MKELQVIAHAKEYLEKLAWGVEPISGQPAPEDKTLNRMELSGLFIQAARLLQEEAGRAEGRPATFFDQEKISEVAAQLDKLSRGVGPDGGAILEDSVLGQEKLQKCFLYTSQVLQKRLAAERTAARQGRAVYALSPEEVRSRLVFSPEPVSLAQFLEQPRRLLGLAGEKSTLTRVARDWLIQEGYLARWEEDSQGVRVTPKGSAIGILAEDRISQRETPYQIISYGEQGQRFLADSLEAILAFKREQWEPLLACLTPEFLEGILCGTEEVSLTEFLKGVNDRLPPDLPRRFEAPEVNAWLLKQGLLEEQFRGKTRAKVPTESGEALGIVLGTMSNGMKQTYAHWTPEGQRFLRDHLRDIAQSLQSGEAYQLFPVEFSITEELLGRFSYIRDDYPGGYVTTARMYTLLNDLLEPELGFCLPKGVVSSWLLEEGFLVRAPRPGKSEDSTMLVPTESGRTIGLILETKDYTFLVYREAAQRYVVEHLQDIITYWRGW